MTAGLRSYVNYDPASFVDHEVETTHFEELARFEDERRILAITAAEGRGKSHFLMHLRFK